MIESKMTYNQIRRTAPSTPVLMQTEDGRIIFIVKVSDNFELGWGIGISDNTEFVRYDKSERVWFIEYDMSKLKLYKGEVTLWNGD